VKIVVPALGCLLCMIGDTVDSFNEQQIYCLCIIKKGSVVMLPFKNSFEVL
jgi:hypothetical protein